MAFLDIPVLLLRRANVLSDAAAALSFCCNSLISAHVIFRRGRKLGLGRPGALRKLKVAVCVRGTVRAPERLLVRLVLRGVMRGAVVDVSLASAACVGDLIEGVSTDGIAARGVSGPSVSSAIPGCLVSGVCTGITAFFLTRGLSCSFSRALRICFLLR